MVGRRLFIQRHSSPSLSISASMHERQMLLLLLPRMLCHCQMLLMLLLQQTTIDPSLHRPSIPKGDKSIGLIIILLWTNSIVMQDIYLQYMKSRLILKHTQKGLSWCVLVWTNTSCILNFSQSPATIQAKCRDKQNSKILIDRLNLYSPWYTLTVWNSLPDSLKHFATSRKHFRKELKTYLFRKAYAPASENYWRVNLQ